MHRCGPLLHMSCVAWRVGHTVRCAKMAQPVEMQTVFKDLYLVVSGAPREGALLRGECVKYRDCAMQR